MGNTYFFALGLGVPAVTALFALWLIVRVQKADPGSERMQQIARLVRQGAMAFLKTEYTRLAIFVAVMFVVLAAALPGGLYIAISFVVGAVASALAGWIGMDTATRAAVRTTQAARQGVAPALRIAFSSGAVMGLTVVALGTIGISVLYWVYGGLEGNPHAADYLFGFSLGASSIALFARVGGGIFTKGADMAADLSGKVEAGIPEDDPRNPATIADNVGDNVGDVAGMGADLYESYVGSIISGIALGWELTAARATELWGIAAGAFAGLQPKLIIFPILLAGVGMLSSILGTAAVRTNDERKVQAALFRGLTVASGLVVAGTAALVHALELPWQLFWAVVVGLGAGVIIGKTTEYYTSKDSPLVRKIAEQAQTGPATNVLAGVATGMLSCAIPVVTIGLSIYLSYHFAGLYGIAIAAVGMLSTLGISLGIDAYGPVADNAGGIAQMAGLPPEVRSRTDALDAVGNTTAAMGKGFAIGSAALTALAFFSAFRQASTSAVEAAGGARLFDPRLLDFSLDNPNTLIGLLIGALMPFLFSALALGAVGRAANAMIEEVRRQFRNIPGLLEGKAQPDSASCVAISTQTAIRAMIAPGLLAVVMPVLVGALLGVAGMAGLLAGALASGVLLALFMANAGGAWDNAKKFIEEGFAGGKGSDAHKAAVIGDTVGDPFKDTAGPSLNILIKLMSVVAIVFVPLIISWLK